MKFFILSIGLFVSTVVAASPNNIGNLNAKEIQDFISNVNLEGHENSQKAVIKVLEMMKLPPEILATLKKAPSSMNEITTALYLCKRDSKCKINTSVATFRILLPYDIRSSISEEDVKLIFKAIDDLSYIVGEYVPKDAISSISEESKENIFEDIYMLRTKNPNVSQYHSILKGLFNKLSIQRSPDHFYVRAMDICFNGRGCENLKPLINDATKRKNAKYAQKLKVFFEAIHDVDIQVTRKIADERKLAQAEQDRERKVAQAEQDRESELKRKLAKRHGFSDYHEGISDFLYRLKNGFTEGRLEKNKLLVAAPRDNYRVESIVGDYIIYHDGAYRVAIVKEQGVIYIEESPLLKDYFKVLGVDEFQNALGITKQLIVLQSLSLE